MRFPHAHVDNHVRVERANELSDPTTVVNIDSFKLRATEETAWRIDIETCNIAGPFGALEVRCDEGAQLAAHPGHQDTTTSHDSYAKPLRCFRDASESAEFVGAHDELA